MPLPPDTKPCLTCGTMLRGRTDKKFCDDYCRSAYNNKMHPAKADFVRTVNAILRKNRSILQDIMSRNDDVCKVPTSRLARKGFNFDFLTNAYTNKDGAVYYCCYEYGYMLLDNGWCYVIKRDAVIDRK